MRELGLALLCGLAAPGPAGAQAVSGTVYEGSAPSPNAFVIVHWTGTRPGFGHYESVCIQAAITRTDAQGRYELAEPPPLRSTFLVWRRDPAVAYVQEDGIEVRLSAEGLASLMAELQPQVGREAA